MARLNYDLFSGGGAREGQKSTLDREIWKLGTTQLPHEHFDPHQSNEPNLASHLGQLIFGEKSKFLFLRTNTHF